MLRLLVYVALGYLLYRLAGILLRKREIPRPDPDRGVETFRDPVCGTYVTLDDAIVGKLEDGKKLYFCSMECLDKYRENLANKNT